MYITKCMATTWVTSYWFRSAEKFLDKSQRNWLRVIELKYDGYSNSSKPHPERRVIAEAICYCDILSLLIN